ncbi:MAG: DinB family protein [Anaerolineales bacterium]
MLDFAPVRSKEMGLSQLVSDLTPDDLRDLTNEMIDKMLDLTADAVDADVTFVPHDPHAHDPYAADDSDTELAWTLGHVIVHATASAEEAAFIAAELARGVEYHGRSRYEVPWETVTTVDQIRRRLEESRRMRLAMLAVWPDEPVIIGKADPVLRFVGGLKHDDDHLGQIAEIMRQARMARNGNLG